MPFLLVDYLRLDKIKNEHPACQAFIKKACFQNRNRLENAKI